MPITADSMPKSPFVDYADSARLAGEITRLSAYIYAATYRLLLLIREYDEKKYWHQPGLCSCAHWLNFQCGIGMNAAREKVRVAHALKTLPKISERFRKGELSYSKVRAMTRIADDTNEDYLMKIARHGTAHHVEKLVSKYRTCVRQQENQLANDQHERRELLFSYDQDGAMILKGRFPAEQGQLIKKALELSMQQAEQESTEVTAETRAHETSATRRADALSVLAETFLSEVSTNTPANTPTKTSRKNSTADHHQVVVHVSAETLKQDVTAETSTHINGDMSHIENGPHVTAETSRRIACDCSIVGIIEDQAGKPLSVGRKTRSIPPALRRALRSRDQGCRFPGCTHSRFIDGHHIKHWADGGETSMDNLVQLCRHHHRLVHEGGFGCERQDDGEIVFTDLRDKILPASPCTMTIDDHQMIEGWITDWMPDVEIDEKTCPPHWYAGDTMDWDIAVGNLFQ